MLFLPCSLQSGRNDCLGVNLKAASNIIFNKIVARPKFMVKRNPYPLYLDLFYSVTFSFMTYSLCVIELSS